MIPGHEFIGHITAVGDKVTEHNIGDRVGVSPVSRSCNECEQCTTQHRQLCPTKVTTYNGKYKDQMTYGVSIINAIYFWIIWFRRKSIGFI